MNFPNYENGLETITNHGLLWINLEKPTREKIATISKKFPIHELNMEDSLSKNQLPKIDRYDDHFLLYFIFLLLLIRNEPLLGLASDHYLSERII